MIYLLGSIPLGIAPVTGPVGHDFSMANSFAQHGPTRGKPVLQEIGSELDTRNFDFFFAEEFCTVEMEFARLHAAFLLKSPMPLLLGSGGYDGKRYVVETLSGRIVKTGARGQPTRIEATIGLLEDPVSGGLGALNSSIAKARAPAVSASAKVNPEIRK